MLEIKNLSAGYDDLSVLGGVTLCVKTGEIVALIGPNGAGKSTVLKSIFGQCRVTGGSILYEGENILALGAHELIRMGISYVNQGRIVFGNLRVFENLQIGADTLDEPDGFQKNLSIVYQKFPILGSRANSFAWTLSGGERQQLALGRALMQEPSLLLLDEPSLGLSPKLQQQLFRTIKSLSEQGIAILIVEQNAKSAISIADRTYLLENGKVVLEGGREILKNAKIKNVYLGGEY